MLLATNISSKEYKLRTLGDKVKYYMIYSIFYDYVNHLDLETKTTSTGLDLGTKCKKTKYSIRISNSVEPVDKDDLKS